MVYDEVVDVSDREQIPHQIRQQVLQEADYSCQLCPERGTQVGGDATLHLHHRRSPADGGTNDPSNIVVLCDDCHHHHHSGRTDPEEVDIDLEESDINTTPADYKLINAIEDIAPATTGYLAEEANISDAHALRRLYALAAVNVVSMTADREWDLAGRVDDPLRGQLPDDPERATRHARDDVIRRMRDRGEMSHAEIARIVGLDERTIPTACNRARAFDPPIPPADSTTEPDVSDLARRVASLEQQLDGTT
jgi:hypothetical protein